MSVAWSDSALISNARHKNAVHILMLWVNIQEPQGENREHRNTMFALANSANVGIFIVVGSLFSMRGLYLMEFAVCPWWKTSLSALRPCFCKQD